MTKAQMAQRIKDLEEELGIKTKPTKMQEIEALETETMVKVKDLVRNCESITGRALESCSGEAKFSLEVKNSSTPLRAMVEELRDFAMNSGNYDFQNDYVLAKWVFQKLANE